MYAQRLLGFSSILLISGFFLTAAKAQNNATVFGAITDSLGRALPYTSATIPSINKGAVSDETGNYRLTLPSGDYEIIYSLIGYRNARKKFHLNPGEKVEINIILKIAIKTLEEVSVTHQADRLQEINRISVKEFESMPNPGGSLESLIKTLPGVSSANELSSQYSVRGGNFDENLVYVNDIEIIRPFLIQSGQQEGLSFINPDLVESVRFYAGGFEARYGDKMSSVLDVTYRTPEKAAGSVSLSLMGGSVSAEGVSKNQKLSLITGVRYKTTRLLLNSLDSKGEYKPDFTDWQMLLNYKINNKFIIGLLTNYAKNAYSYIPTTRSVTFGTYANVYNLKIYYDGNEKDMYNSISGGLTLHYTVNPDIRMKLIFNAYSNYEQEKFDISGEYLINELDAYSGSTTYSDSILNLGVGGMLSHARNYLQADIRCATYMGNWQLKNHNINWAVGFQHDHFRDRMSEWEYIDSAGYSSPYNEDQIILNNYVSSRNNISTNRITAFVQDALKWKNSKANYSLNVGLRLYNWSFNHELLLSPRIRFFVQPKWERDIAFYAATGIYYQPPLFKEMRNTSGEINYHIKSQQSIHFLLGSDMILNIWERPFKYTIEAYYKYLDRLIPYKIDNVRIKYSAQNNAKGYATGLDMKLYGEFVEGIESWVSISVLSTKEDIIGDYYINKNGERIEPGYYHRPTDQLFHINLFFQDYLPNYPTVKASVNLVYGSGFFVSPPQSSRYDETYPLGSYRRVDFGMYKTLKFNSLPQIKSFWIGADVFNLFDIKNKASFMWIQTVNNQENVPNTFAVPNYLTSRRLNVRMTIKF